MQEVPGHEDVASLRVTGPETDRHSAPLDVLVRVFHGIQQAVFLIAASKTQKKLTHRFRPSQEVRRAFELRAGVLKQGSVKVDLFPGAAQDAQELGLGLTPDEALTQLLEVMRAVQGESEEELLKLLNDTPYRDRVMREIVTFLPKPGERWGIAFQYKGGPEVQLGQRHARVVKQWIQATATGDQAVMTITCELLGIHFAANEVEVLYRPTGLKFALPYSTDVEELLFDHRREDIQVTGRFETDEDGHPMKQIGEASIEMLDLSPFEIDRVERNGRTLTLTRPLRLEPVMDDEVGQYLEVRDPQLGIDASARTREALLDELEAQLFYLWDTFARGNEARMTTRAAARAQYLRDCIQEGELAVG